MNQGIVPDEVGKDHLNWDKCVDESLGYWNEEIPEFNGSNKMKVSFPLTEQSEKAKWFLLGKFICHSWHFPFQLLLLLVDGKVRELKVSVSVPCLSLGVEMAHITPTHIGSITGKQSYVYI